MTDTYGQFSQDIDNIIRHDPAAREAQTETNQRDIHIIHALAAVDFSRESRVRQNLRQKLLTKEKEPIMNSLAPRKPLLRLTIIGMILALFLFAASPMGVTLAQSIVNIVQTWRLGDGSTAVSVEGDFVAVPDENGDTIIQPAPAGGLEEPSLEGLAEGETPALDTNVSYEQAAELVSFKLLQPNSNFIPDGYEFQGVTVSNAESAQMDYIKFEDIGLIGLGQTVVEGINGDIQVTFTSDMTTAEVHVRGQDGLWVSTEDGFGMLIWEANGINYQLQLMGVGSLELALQIAESLE